MKKSRTVINALALVLALGAALAFKANNRLPGNLYYYDEARGCVAAPCATVDQIAEFCSLEGPFYWENQCQQKYIGLAYATDGGGK